MRAFSMLSRINVDGVDWWPLMLLPLAFELVEINFGAISQKFLKHISIFVLIICSTLLEEISDVKICPWMC